MTSNITRDSNFGSDEKRFREASVCLVRVDADGLGHTLVLNGLLVTT